MIKPDVIVSWSRSCDFPLWRQFIRDNRDRFNEVIIVFTESNRGKDYREFIKSAMLRDHVLFVDIQKVDGRDDWRNIAVNAALLHSYNSEWIWFTEQDFFPKNQGFWDEVYKKADEGFDAIGVKYADRLHPCSLFMKRTALNKSGKNFGIVPDHSDHFSLIQKDIENPANDIKLAVISEEYWTHLNGLTHNYTLVEDGGAPNYHPEEFTLYLLGSLGVSVPISEEWKNIFFPYLQRAGMA